MATTIGATQIHESFSLFYTSSIDGRMVLENNETTYVDDELPYTVPDRDLVVAYYVVRVVGSISLLCSCVMFVVAIQRRNLLFHRLVLGMSSYLIILAVCLVIGPAAIPKDTTNAYGNIGTIASCTAQGFFIFLCTMTANFYYCSFSVYSYVGITNNFEQKKYSWVEKYIHIFVPIYPYSAAFYLLSVDAFNNNGNGFCLIENDPLDCGDYTNEHGFVPCERGQETNEEKRMLLLFVLIPTTLLIIIPTVVMSVLVYKVKKNQAQIKIQAKKVACQSSIYLLALYVGFLPALIYNALLFSKSHFGSLINQFSYLGNFAYSLFGLWTMLVYLYFSISSKKNLQRSSILMPGNILLIDSELGRASVTSSSDLQPITTDSIDPKRKQAAKTSENESERRQQIKYSFNIFDGTNATGAYADFIHDGDSDDERMDKQEALHWEQIQSNL